MLLFYFFNSELYFSQPGLSREEGNTRIRKSVNAHLILGFAVEFIFFPSDEEVEWLCSASCLSPGGHTSLGILLLHGTVCLGIDFHLVHSLPYLIVENELQD